MRKLKLDIADLEVTSFDTDRAAGIRGTVAGHVTLPATHGTNCNETNDCTYLGTGCGTNDYMGCSPTFDCDPSGGDPSCADYSCVDGSGCGLCYTQSCEVTYCTCPGTC
jgi:hypothetical protein